MRAFRFSFLVLFIFLGSRSVFSQITVNATGNQIYCPLDKQPIVSTFSITVSDGSPVTAVYIQISKGYLRGQDRLSLSGTHPNISESFNSVDGKLTLKSTSSVPNTAFENAVKDVVFENSSINVSGEREFSITVGDANYLPFTGHYYEFVSSLGITWTAAKAAAETRTYYGLQGYLATLTSAQESTFAGKQSTGTGWIGGSDATTEGIWKWETGPEKGEIFWNGGINGSSPTGAYVFWNNGEPNNLGNEDYAHITAPNVGITGSWNDLSNTGASSGDFQPKGYIVEYGKPGDPPLNITTSTKLYIPNIIDTEPGSICGSGTVNLKANASNGTVFWFDSQTSTTPIGSGPSFTSPVLNATKSYYVLASDIGCTNGPRTEVQATVHPIPIIESTNGATVCYNGSAQLMATASAGKVEWFSSAYGGSPIFTGSVFVTPALSTSTTYYVSAIEENCSSNQRTAIQALVQHVDLPTANPNQQFCSDENPTIQNLTISGSNIKWYDSQTGGNSLPLNTALVSNTRYYASQTLNSCESENRLAVTAVIFDSPHPATPGNIPKLSQCDSGDDGDVYNGIDRIDLTQQQAFILNSQPEEEFILTYYTDANYNDDITNPKSFVNNKNFNQTIYVEMSNKLDQTCVSQTSFDLQINALPKINFSVLLKNCDEDGTPDGYTDYNLTESNKYIANGIEDLTFSYYLEKDHAIHGIQSIDGSSYNNQSSNTVFVRVENLAGCFDIATITLEVSITSFEDGYILELQTCESDTENDGLHIFDLTQASNTFIDYFDVDQNLSVHYYRNLDDAQLERNEIVNQVNYKSELPYSQVLFVRVESLDNGDCFGIGPHLQLTVHGRPEFETVSETVLCLNLQTTELEVLNPQETYTYEWFNDEGVLIGSEKNQTVTDPGVYTVIANSINNCDSFPHEITVIGSNIAVLKTEHITVVENSTNNSISISTANNALGIGTYEFALDDEFGYYQDDPYFDRLLPGIHTLFIRDLNNCGTLQVEIPVLGFAKFFTPNQDGYNDVWEIKGLSNEYVQNSHVFIFNRFGALLYDFKPQTGGWDGTLNGEPLPATEYWYKVELWTATGLERILKGHFSLIRR